MRVRLFAICIIAYGVILATPNTAYSKEDRKLYFQGMKAARGGELDFAFINFFRLVEFFPDSEFLEDALFATGEYYYLVKDYYDARRTFRRFVDEYPNSKSKIFALIYLLEIGRLKDRGEDVERLGREIVTSQQLSLLFRDFKEYSYVSAFSIKYKAVYYIDTVKFYRNDELFSEVRY
jgi:outer membrane protein assembly factor BamD (BamD/ComL family)